MSKKPKRLKNLKITSVGLVDKGAGKGVRVMLAKRDDAHETKEESKQMPTPEGMPEELSALVEQWPDDAREMMNAYIESLKAAMEKEGDAEEEEEEEAKLGEEMEKGLPEDVQKRIAEERAERDVLAKRVQELEEVEKHRNSLAKAQEIGEVPGLSGEELAGIMREAGENLSKNRAELLEKAFKASAAVADKSALFKGVGSGHDVSDLDTASRKLNGLAKALMANDPDLSRAHAVRKAAEANPKLYDAYVNERGGH